MAASEETIFSFSIMDESRELATTKFRIIPINAETYDDHITLRDALIDAIEDVIDGTIQKSSSAVVKNFNATAPSNVNSERERKILVTMNDNTLNHKQNFTIGCRKNWTATWKKIVHSDEIDPAGTEAAALITAINNIWRSPAGYAGNVIKLTAVGRNL